ncbi:MAG: sensor histidine kinase [Marivivens sp.]|jgi:two-component system, OmpR family, sensor histidine kinase TctE|nr:sensor histidine kinase [Marivivens geojensis]NBQ49595.1 sensor histidine kinase [Marivivens sp.]NBX09684.1 sensor histidine kinase [Marivivens sp.]NCW68121.1 sensor histidine kinase [Marivivens sp.]
MKTDPHTLRFRLFVLILTPLLIVSLFLGYWRFSVAQQTANELFDRGLLSTALAISRDVASSEGDALSPSTRDLLTDASGGEVFYHATGPGGYYVTGYAYPPIEPTALGAEPQTTSYFEAIYRDEPVRVLKLTENAQVGGITGQTIIRVWQRMSDRNEFARDLALKAAALMGALLVTLALVVWFGVQLGLRPLNDLQDAIDKRSQNDLSPIKRAVPGEVKGIVRTLNRLFGQVSDSISAQQAFISDAAHQLRNPAAGILAMAEAVKSAKTNADREQRIDKLLYAAKHSAHVTEQLLSLERLTYGRDQRDAKEIDLNAIVSDVCTDFAYLVLKQDVRFEFNSAGQPIKVFGTEVLLKEAIKNILDNALTHGGPSLSTIVINCDADGDHAKVSIWDDGKDLHPDNATKIFGRFTQLEPNSGSGLGLAIANEIVQQSNGSLTVDPVAKGAQFTMRLPISA